MKKSAVSISALVLKIFESKLVLISNCDVNSFGCLSLRVEISSFANCFRTVCIKRTTSERESQTRCHSALIQKSLVMEFQDRYQNFAGGLGWVIGCVIFLFRLFPIVLFYVGYWFSIWLDNFVPLPINNSNVIVHKVWANWENFLSSLGNSEIRVIVLVAGIILSSFI